MRTLLGTGLSILFSWLCDISALAIIYFLTTGAMQLLPIPTMRSGLLIVIVFLIVRRLLQSGFKNSLGQRVWKNQGVLALLSTLALTSVAIFLGMNTLENHPLLMAATEIKFPEFVPSAEEVKVADWTIMPFYYSNGAWPLKFSGKPIFFTMPYEKGPPSRFLGHISARWDMPETQLTFAGPRTPEIPLSREDLRNCFLAAVKCPSARRDALQKNIEEMKELGLRQWKLSWFSVENPHIPEEDRPSGIWLSAQNKTHAQDRIILVNANTAQQMFILDRPLNAEGDAARVLFEQALRSQRVATELDVGRAWINRQLGSVQLESAESAKKMSDPSAFVAKIARAQALLISKISVDPKTLDTYFHLGGTGLLLSQLAMKLQNTEWSAAAKPVVQNSFRYAQDVAPDNIMTRKLESFWIEVKTQ